MNNKSKLLIIGGDSRLEYTARFLSEKGFDVTEAKSKYDIKHNIDSTDCIILPLPVSRDSLNLNIQGEEIPLNSLVKMLSPGKKVYGGMFTPPVKALFTLEGIDVVDYFLTKETVIKNAIPTAEGVLGIIITKFPVTVHSLKCAVTGYGNCGSRIARSLYSLGAEVTVAARSESDLANAFGDGLKTCYLRDFGSICSDFEVIVNTVPSTIIDENILKKLSKSCTVIETASSPFGVDFDKAERYSVNVIKASSLPGKTAPKTAGKIIAEAIMKY